MYLMHHNFSQSKFDEALLELVTYIFFKATLMNDLHFGILIKTI